MTRLSLALLLALASCGLPARDEARLRDLIDRLDASSIDDREDAYAEIVAMGPRALLDLRAALGGSTSLDVRDRLEDAITAIEVEEITRRLRRALVKVAPHSVALWRGDRIDTQNVRFAVELASGLPIRVRSGYTLELSEAVDDTGRRCGVDSCPERFNVRFCSETVVEDPPTLVFIARDVSPMARRIEVVRGNLTCELEIPGDRFVRRTIPFEIRDVPIR